MLQGTEFSATDAQLMLNIASSAPIPNMQEADGRSKLFQRYALFVNAVFAPPVDKAGKGSKGGKKTTADDSPSPAA